MRHRYLHRFSTIQRQVRHSPRKISGGGLARALHSVFPIFHHFHSESTSHLTVGCDPAGLSSRSLGYQDCVGSSELDLGRSWSSWTVRGSFASALVWLGGRVCPGGPWRILAGGPRGRRSGRGSGAEAVGLWRSMWGIRSGTGAAPAGRVRIVSWCGWTGSAPGGSRGSGGSVDAEENTFEGSGNALA